MSLSPVSTSLKLTPDKIYCEKNSCATLTYMCITWGLGKTHFLFCFLGNRIFSRSFELNFVFLRFIQKCNNRLYCHEAISYSNTQFIPFPKCVFMLMYLAVPVKLLCSRYGICFLVSGSMYSFARPKSIMWIVFSLPEDLRPIRKFSGFMSL